jgi:ElaB/YqjD/DUF883 family membrane-anchored ribosome-binding protein
MNGITEDAQKLADDAAALAKEAGQTVVDTPTSLLDRLNAAAKEVEDFVSHEANQARTKLREAIYWLGIHVANTAPPPAPAPAATEEPTT